MTCRGPYEKHRCHSERVYSAAWIVWVPVVAVCVCSHYQKDRNPAHRNWQRDVSAMATVRSNGTSTGIAHSRIGSRMYSCGNYETIPVSCGQTDLPASAERLQGCQSRAAWRSGKVCQQFIRLRSFVCWSSLRWPWFSMLQLQTVTRQPLAVLGVFFYLVGTY